ncbi:MAG TPA: tRNA (adenosine(37)-N6)-threonylcarbamoyltransferase complex ATPase subunit type 1 TsaE [Nevskiales bacterium]|nr:tRNA (adenosine(37)-N6)-threonylcarbamoyltransferase complex ATPase subunit type 1 TsaE [Nevskiales bacterium]
MNARDFTLADAADTEHLGAALARALGPCGAVIYLSGELGAGKTTLTRALLQALGYTGRVRSPTYTLVEPYEIAGRRVFHLDLYRLTGAEELEYLGLRDLDPDQDLILVEWPERGQGGLPAADLQVELQHWAAGRKARLLGVSLRGNTILSGLSA